MGFATQVGHGVDRQGDIEAVFVGEARGRFDADRGSDAAEHDLGHALALQPGFEVGVGEGAPGLLGHQVVGRLLLQFGDQVGEVRRKFAAHLMLGAAGRAAGDIDQADRQIAFTEGIEKGNGIRDNAGHGFGRGEGLDTFLQVDDDEGGLRIEGSDGHVELLWGLIEKAFEQIDAGGNGSLFLRRETGGDGLAQPVVARGAIGLDQVAAGLGQGQEGLAAVGWIGCADDEAPGLQRRYGSAHGLRAHALGLGQACQGLRPFVSQPHDHRCFRWRQAVLRRLVAQAAAQLGGQGADVGGESVCHKNVKKTTKFNFV